MTGQLEMRSVAGYPPAPFCVAHDRFVAPVEIRETDSIMQLACPYCLQEELSDVSEAETCYSRQQCWHGTSSTTYFCPTCSSSFYNHNSLEEHQRKYHPKGDRAEEICQFGSCKEIATDICRWCEEFICRHHLDARADCCMRCEQKFQAGMFC